MFVTSCIRLAWYDIRLNDFCVCKTLSMYFRVNVYIQTLRRRKKEEKCAFNHKYTVVSQKWPRGSTSYPHEAMRQTKFH